MSGRREKYFYEQGSFQTISADEFFVTSIAANDAIKVGDELSDAHTRLQGTIDSFIIKLRGVVVLPIDIMVFSGATGAETVLANDRYIDHESVVTGDYMEIPTGESPAVRRVGITGLSIPYYDRDGTKKFHIGIRNQSASTAIPINSLTIGWTWRADHGEP
jgi:hypothetical protein